MSPSTLWGAAVSTAFVAGVSLVSILQAGDWARVSTLARCYIFTYITPMDQHQDSIQYAVWASVSSKLVGKCQLDLYKVLHICLAVALSRTEQTVPQLTVQY